MNDRIRYDSIKDAVIYAFDEYINEEHFNVCQTAAKIIEEDWREVNYNAFTRASYFLNISIEAIKLGEIPDFVFMGWDNTILDCVEGVPKNEEELYMQDLVIFNQLKKGKRYKVVETSFATQSRIQYLLSLTINS